MIVLRLFSKRWILTTVLALVGTAVLARLGIWQLDRLAERKVFNARVEAAMSLPVLTLDSTALDTDLANMEYRTVEVRGKYDFTQQVALRNQVYEGQPGVDLLTPLKIDGTDRYVLVNRGWIDQQDEQALTSQVDWNKYDEPGAVTVKGVVRRAQVKPDFGMVTDSTPPPGGRLMAWNLANIPQIAAQMPYSLLPVYIQQAPDAVWTKMPYRSQPELDLSEGPHFSYALQWFAFAALLFFGYPFFVQREEKAIKKSPPESSLE